MSKKVRRNVFETNSSSTHSICVTKNNILNNKINYVNFTFGEFGWSNETYYSIDEKAKYLYTAIYCNNRVDLLEKIKKVLDENNITYEFEEPKFSHSLDNTYSWFDSGYIDHSGELSDFLEICEDENRLMRYLFSSESFVITGNDNDDHDINIKVNYDYEEYYKGN